MQVAGYRFKHLSSEVGVHWLCCQGIVWKPIREISSQSLQLIREHLSTIISACWATVDWFLPEEWNWCVKHNLNNNKKVRAGRDWIIKPSPKIHRCKEKGITPPCGLINLQLMEGTLTTSNRSWQCEPNKLFIYQSRTSTYTIHHLTICHKAVEHFSAWNIFGWHPRVSTLV